MKLLVSALDYSANIHLKTLMQYLPENIELVGIFDASLGKPLEDVQSHAIMGFVDAIKKMKYYRQLMKQMVELTEESDKVLLIDSSGFNIPLAKRIKKRYPNKEIIYYILPQAWAWRKKRIVVLEKNIDSMASILPFEKMLYSDDANIEYVGHPLLDIVKYTKKEPNQEIKKIAFLPGSRRSEIQKLMPIFREVSKELALESTLVIPNHLSEEEIVKLYGDLKYFKVTKDTHQALYNVDFAFICNGTATLEAALIGTPFVLVYQFSFVDYILYRLLVKIDFIGLGNILLKANKDRALHPELIQKDVTKSNLIATMTEMDRKAFYQNSLNLLNYLKQGSAKNTAQIIMQKRYNIFKK